MVRWPSPANDLVYTMIDPCRIVDTRLAVGALSANIARSFISDGASFASQGGAANNCNIPADPSALVLNVTVLGPAGGPSHIRLYPYGTPIPNTVAVNYTAGQRISNEVIVKMTPGQPLNFSAISGFGTHIVIDVAGYFMAPVATALDCYNVLVTVEVATGTRGNATAECPAGYTLTGGGSVWSNVDNDGPIYNVSRPGNGTNEAFGYNTSGSNSNLFSYGSCCRIPGR
jgi:hypothetical protein